MAENDTASLEDTINEPKTTEFDTVDTDSDNLNDKSANAGAPPAADLSANQVTDIGNPAVSTDYTNSAVVDCRHSVNCTDLSNSNANNENINKNYKNISDNKVNNNNNNNNCAIITQPISIVDQPPHHKELRSTLSTTPPVSPISNTNASAIDSLSSSDDTTTNIIVSTTPTAIATPCSNNNSHSDHKSSNNNSTGNSTTDTQKEKASTEGLSHSKEIESLKDNSEPKGQTGGNSSNPDRQIAIGNASGEIRKVSIKSSNSAPNLDAVGKIPGTAVTQETSMPATVAPNSSSTDHSTTSAVFRVPNEAASLHLASDHRKSRPGPLSLIGTDRDRNGDSTNQSSSTKTHPYFASLNAQQQKNSQSISLVPGAGRVPHRFSAASVMQSQPFHPSTNSANSAHSSSSGGSSSYHQHAPHSASNHHGGGRFGGGGGGGGGSHHGLSGGGSHHDSSPMSTDDLLQLMGQINMNVKASNFNANLANQIFRLCNELKNYGEVVEQTHPEEMNRVFVSLRQACCRDSGQLGTPCRLKIMEIIELRAMGWRPNLGLKQYYFQREQMESSTESLTSDVGQAPVSAPPFGAIPINPFGMFNPGGQGGGGNPQAGMIPQGMMHHHGSGSTADMMQSSGNSQPQFYLIPASVAHTAAGIAFVTPSNANMMPQTIGQQQPGMVGGGPGGHHPLAMHPHHHGHPGGPPPSAPPTMMVHPGGFGPGGPIPLTPGMTGSYSPTGFMASSAPPITAWPKGAVIKPSGKFSKPTKVVGKNQYRDEIVIRNADSGKMPPGAKERTLTITGPTEESIVQAKMLVDQTIRRNASPSRAEGADGELMTRFSDDGELVEQFSDMHMSEGDIIGLTCSDPKLLQAAKDALREYFERHGSNSSLRRSYTDTGLSKEEKKERRKSMPPISQPVMTPEPETYSVQLHTPTVTFLEENKSPKYKRFQSTPNLAQVPEELLQHHANGATMGTPSKSPLGPMFSDPERSTASKVHHLGFRDGAGDAVIVDKTGGTTVQTDSGKSGFGHMRVVYTREFLLQCSLSPLTKMPPPGIAKLASEENEVLRDLPGNFEPAEYKEFCGKLKQQRQLDALMASQQQSPYAGTPAGLTPTQFVFA